MSDRFLIEHDLSPHIYQSILPLSKVTFCTWCLLVSSGWIEFRHYRTGVLSLFWGFLETHQQPIYIRRKYCPLLFYLSLNELVKRMCLRQCKHFFSLRTNYDFHGRETRNSNMLYINSLNFLRNGNSSPFLNALTEYNRLLDDIRMRTTSEIFRKKTSLHLLEENNIFQGWLTVASSVNCCKCLHAETEMMNVSNNVAVPFIRSQESVWANYPFRSAAVIKPYQMLLKSRWRMPDWLKRWRPSDHVWGHALEHGT